MAENINRTISIQAEDAGAVETIDRLRETGGRMYEDIRRRAEQYTKELEEQASQVQKLIDKEKELQQIQGQGGSVAGMGGAGGRAVGGNWWQRRPQWMGGQGSGAGKGAQTSSDDEGEAQDESKANPTVTLLKGLGLFGVATLMGQAVEAGKKEMIAEAREGVTRTSLSGRRTGADTYGLAPSETGLDWTTGNWVTDNSALTTLGINRAMSLDLFRQAGQAGGNVARQDMTGRLLMERGLGMDMGALQGLEEMGFAGSRGNERVLTLIQKMISSGIWDIDKTDINAIGKGIQNMIALNKVEYGLFADFTGKGTSDAMARIGSAGGMFQDPNRQMGLMMGMHQDITSGGNPFIDAIINESILRQNPDLGMNPMGMTMLRAKRSRGIFEEGI